MIGRRELSSLEPFDLILLVILGDAVQQGLTQDDYSMTGALIAISTIAAGMPEIEKATRKYDLDEYYSKALSLVMSGKARDAFDLSKEKPELREVSEQDQGLRAVVRRHAVLELAVASETVFWNLNDPDAYAAALAATVVQP